MALLDDNDVRRESIRSDIVEETLKDPSKQDSATSDPFQWGWILSIGFILAWAIVFGLLSAFGDFIDQFSPLRSMDHYTHNQTVQRVLSDTMPAFIFRFLKGAGLGALIGGSFVVLLRIGRKEQFRNEQRLRKEFLRRRD